MTRGKRICNELKAVRRRIADENSIELHQAECNHTGNCLGTCPKCESEVRWLEQALTRRVAAGQAATVAGLTLSLAACGGTAEPTLSVDTPLDTLPTDTVSAFDTIINEDTDILVNGLEDDTFSTLSGIIGPSEKDPAEVIDSSATKEDEDWMGVIIEESPSFPGGEGALYDFIEKNLQYPEAAREAHVTGTVVVSFVVEKNGTIGNVRIIRDLGYGCGEEAVRIVKMMPKWNPGKQSGIKVRSEFTLPVQFKLD